MRPALVLILTVLVSFSLLPVQAARPASGAGSYACEAPAVQPFWGVRYPVVPFVAIAPVPAGTCQAGVDSPAYQSNWIPPGAGGFFLHGTKTDYGVSSFVLHIQGRGIDKDILVGRIVTGTAVQYSSAWIPFPVGEFGDLVETGTLPDGTVINFTWHEAPFVPL